MLPKWLTPNPRKLNQNRGPLHLDKNNNLLQRMQWKKKLINPLLDQSFNMHKQLCLNLISLHDLWLLGWLLCLPPKYRLGQQRQATLHTVVESKLIKFQDPISSLFRPQQPSLLL
ncbi:hypothetical protein PIB30_108378 [Stylosanthes scabra]|uniref:Uncharacterized protein n=1 Tax=Stylosanthes scabra TaxID=79078 RepID=A0ABU6SZP7_9FABA|nr:hypothetical protein [Stylosanthes scabra]